MADRTSLRVAVRVRIPFKHETNCITCNDKLGSKVAINGSSFSSSTKPLGSGGQGAAFANHDGLPFQFSSQYHVVLGPKVLSPVLENCCQPRTSKHPQLRHCAFPHLRHCSLCVLQVGQHETYMECGVPQLDALFEGQNTCILAYGQTGSGKTFSMFGADGGRNPAKLDGLVPQLVSDIFRRVSRLERQGETEYRLGVTFHEIIRGQVLDLLTTDDYGRPAPLEVRSTPTGAEVLFPL